MKPMDFLVLKGVAATCSSTPCRILSPRDFQAGYEKGAEAVIIDVRTSEEYAEGHIEGAMLLDVTDGAAFASGIAKLDKEKTYYIYCRSGHRSSKAARQMNKRGLKVRDLAGGIIAWTNAGMPVTHK